jgi:hypothetical protein
LSDIFKASSNFSGIPVYQAVGSAACVRIVKHLCQANINAVSAAQPYLTKVLMLAGSSILRTRIVTRSFNASSSFGVMQNA